MTTQTSNPASSETPAEAIARLTETLAIEQVIDIVSVFTVTSDCLWKSRHLASALEGLVDDDTIDDLCDAMDDSRTDRKVRQKEIEVRSETASAQAITRKVSKKAGVSWYGVNGGWPITLYHPQVVRFIASEFGITEWQATTYGKWVETKPSRSFSIAPTVKDGKPVKATKDKQGRQQRGDYSSGADLDWLEKVLANPEAFPYVVNNGDNTLTISLAMSKVKLAS